MNDYFPAEQSMGERIGYDAKMVNSIIASRFRADNPPAPVQYYLRSTENFSISNDYMDRICLHEKFPEMKMEEYAYAWASLHAISAGPFHFRFSAYGPVSIYVNGKLAYRTTLVQERFCQDISDICLELRKGVNSLLFECIRTPLGCGFHIGSSSYKGRRIQFFSPLKERKGMSGFLYSGPYRERKEISWSESVSCRERETGMKWLPRTEWNKEELEQSAVKRIFHLGPQEEVLAAADFFLEEGETVILQGRVQGKIEIYLDGAFARRWDGQPGLALCCSRGHHVLAVRGEEFQIELYDEKKNPIGLQTPVPIQGRGKLSWLYLGPVKKGFPVDLKSALTFEKPIDGGKGMVFWRADVPDCMVRPFNEGQLYGEWNYPLGVTLYGLIETARLTGDSGLDAYVEGHMRKCMDFYEYAFWDKEKYGAASFHNQLTTVDSLDDCGSFASALLEVMKDHWIPEGRKAADMTAVYIKERQQRLPDGTFYRNHSYLPIMNETLWADDMYMSIPFLCRYYQLTGEEAWLDEAANQAKSFFSYLYMPDFNIMSHIYDTHYRLQTKVPWGRGNGWVLFSLAELLEVMPSHHREREDILRIYRLLSEGYAKVQDEEGMWHQVLTVPESYREASCTAMFVYGFAKGVRRGWLTDREKYRSAAEKGWKALCDTVIDWKGNIYGVCRGSGYSFSKEYYGKELSWNFNDTHGTGIVMLAGMEVEKMINGREEVKK